MRFVIVAGIFSAQTASMQDLMGVLRKNNSTLSPAQVSAVYKRLHQLCTKDPEAHDSLALADLLQALALTWLRLLPAAKAHDIAAVLVACQRLQYTDERLWRMSLTAFVDRERLKHAAARELVDVACAAAAVARGAGHVPGFTTEEVKAFFEDLAAQLPSAQAVPRCCRGVTRVLHSYCRWGGELRGLLNEIQQARKYGYTGVMRQVRRLIESGFRQTSAVLDSM